MNAAGIGEDECEGERGTQKRLKREVPLLRRTSWWKEINLEFNGGHRK